MSTITGALANSQQLGVGVQLTGMSNGGQFSTPDGTQVSYRYSGVAFAPVATPTDFIVIQGSATKTLRIKKITLTGAATAAGNLPVQVIRRLSTGGTIGSAVLTAVSPAKADTLSAAATGVVSTVGTANYGTVQTTNGNIASGRISMTALGSGVGIQPLVFDFTSGAVLLRGTSDYVMLNGVGGAIPSGGVVDYTIEIEEDNS